MAAINPVSTSMGLVLSLGQQDGKDVTKSISVSNIDVNASADVLFAASNALGSLLEYPVVMTRRNATGIVVE